jgi:4-hydroxy-2-oxoheptanedioate aldolase
MWQENKVAVNAWLTIPSNWTAEMMAHVGFDSITIDMQHGLADYQTAVSMVQAISTSQAVPLVRLPWNEPVVIMRLLDAGVYGLICPMVNNRSEAEAFVGASRYPPLGYRSYGPIRANLYAGDDYFTHANEEIITLALIETAEALENIDEIVSTPGLDGVYIGTIDLGISMGLAGLGDLSNPKLRNAVDRILAVTKKHQRVAGIHVNSTESAKDLVRWGFQLITSSNDSDLLQRAAQKNLEDTRMDSA